MSHEGRWVSEAFVTVTFLSPSAASDQRPSGDVYLVSMTGDRKFFHFYLVLWLIFSVYLQAETIYEVMKK